METKRQNGQGMKVLVMGSILQLFLGVIYVWSVFVLPVRDHFSWSVDSVKLTSSYMLSFFVLGILFSGRLQGKFGTAPIVLTGGLMMAVGMLLTSLIPGSAPWLIYITYGVVGGFGVGMAYNAIITCAQKWFPHRRGFATGISVCLFGFSTVVFAPLVETLISAVGVQNTFRILAAAFFIAVVALFSFIKLPQDEGAQSTAPVLSGKQYTTSEMLKTKAFYYITLSMMLGTAAYFILNPSFKTLAQERGLPDTIGTVLVMMTGIANALGRLLVPVLSEKLGRERATLLNWGATALCAGLLCFAQGGLFMAAVAVIAFCYGGSSGVYPLITSDAFGLKHVGSNYGAVMVGFALSALFFPMIVNLITNETVKFIVLTLLAMGASMLMLLLRRDNTKRKECA